MFRLSPISTDFADFASPISLLARDDQALDSFIRITQGTLETPRQTLVHGALHLSGSGGHMPSHKVIRCLLSHFPVRPARIFLSVVYVEAEGVRCALLSEGSDRPRTVF